MTANQLPVIFILAERMELREPLCLSWAAAPQYLANIHCLMCLNWCWSQSLWMVDHHDYHEPHDHQSCAEETQGGISPSDWHLFTVGAECM